MEESQTQIGKDWVRQAFERIKMDYQNRFIIQKVFGWRIGDTPESSSPEDPGRDDLIYYLPLQIENVEEIQYIKFVRAQFEDCANPADIQRRHDVEEYIRQRFEFFANQT